MTNIYYQNFQQIQFLCGSSTLVLGQEAPASRFFSEIVNLYAAQGLRRYYPEVIHYGWPVDSPGIRYEEYLKIAEKILVPPREILYQPLGRMFCFGGELILLTGVTDDLVEKYNNQDLTPKPYYVDPQMGDGKTKIYGCAMNEKDYLTALEEQEYYNSLNQPEYPQFDEFGNPTEISWLREYALRAEDFSQRQKVDLFLNLSWNKPRTELPSPFWLLFDRIYEIEEVNDNQANIIQIR